MKKIISTIVIILSILLLSSYVFGATGKITADTLNIRESASQSAKVIARIAKNQEKRKKNPQKVHNLLKTRRLKKRKLQK